MSGSNFQALISRAPVWNTDLNPTLNANATTFDGFGIVSGLAALTKIGIQYRITLKPPTSGANLVLASVWAGMANTAPSFDGGQVQVFFSGSAGVTLTAGGGDTVSDAFAPATNFNTSGQLLIAFGITSGDLRQGTSLTGYTDYFKTGDSANAGTTAKSGYTSNASRTRIFSKIEALQ